jgi:hypothetical protein
MTQAGAAADQGLAVLLRLIANADSPTLSG